MSLRKSGARLASPEPAGGGAADDKRSKDAKDEGSTLGAVAVYMMALAPAVGAAVLLNLLPYALGPAGGAVVQKALARAFKGGVPGAISALVQIVLLMWLRTVTNYQYKHGGTMMGTIATLYKEGGIMRLYQGWHVAAAQVPISRFVDAAANEGMLELFKGVAWLPVLVQTLLASGAAGAFRATLMPLDCIKTELQVHGPKAVPMLKARVAREGVSTFWRGTGATVLAAAVGHYPWFAVRNLLKALAVSHVFPVLGPAPSALATLAVNAVIGFAASVASDTVTNSIRIVKTRVQTSEMGEGYGATISGIVKEGGLTALFFTGLGTKALTSALNGLIFNVIIENYAKA